MFQNDFNLVLNNLENYFKYKSVIRQIRSYSLHDKDGNPICFSVDALLNSIE